MQRKTLEVFKQGMVLPMFSGTHSGEIPLAAVWKLDCREFKKQARRPVRRLLELLPGKSKVTWMSQCRETIILEKPQNLEGEMDGINSISVLRQW